MSTQRAGPGNPNWKGGRTIASNGYVLLKMPWHRLADVRGYVYEHRLVAEGKLDRRLLPGEVVHHVNGVKDDNRPENVEVLTVAEHRKEHARDDRKLVDVPRAETLLAEGLTRGEVAAALGVGVSTLFRALRHSPPERGKR